MLKYSIHIIFFIFFFIFSFILISCENTDQPEISQIVVEGYIDNGKFPIVFVSKAIPLTSEVQELDIMDYCIRWAKVSINDGNNEVVLTGKWDDGYFPPYIYTTTHIRGIENNKYTIKVEYENFKATATTSIPTKPIVDSIKIIPTEVDSLCQIKLCITDNPEERNFYKIFVKKYTNKYNKQWLSSYLGIVSDEVLDNSNEILVNQASYIVDNNDFIPHFSYNDIISIKFAQIDENAYNFWNDYENQTSFSRNPLFPLSENLTTNIDGGFGCWYGCNAVYIDLSLCNYYGKESIIRLKSSQGQTLIPQTNTSLY